MKHPHTPLLLKITSGRLHPLLVSAVLILFFYAILTVIYKIEGIQIIWSNYQKSTYSISAIAFIVYISRVIQNAHHKYFNDLLARAQLSKVEIEEKKNDFHNQKRLWVETLVAIMVGLGHAYFASLYRIVDGSSELVIYTSWTGLMIVLVWVLITQSNSIYIRNMILMNELSEKIEIDLLKLEQFMPLTKAGIISILAFMGAYSILFATGIDFNDLTNPAIIALIPTILYMVYKPLKGINKRISKAKEKEVMLIDRAIEGDISALDHSRIGKNLDNINVIDLINYKKIIQNTLELPVNIPTASRFLFYLIIPFLTWVAASLVDKVLDFMIK